MDLWTVLMTAGSSLLLFAAVACGVHLVAPGWDWMAAKQMGLITQRFDRLGFDRGKLQFGLRVWGAGMLATFFLIWIYFHAFPLAVVAAALAYVAPRHILDYLVHRRERLLRDQLVGATLQMGNTVKAGLSLAQGIASVAEDTSPPLSKEMRRVALDFRRGRPLREAIEEVRSRLELESFNLFAFAIEAAIERGGRVDEVLSRISASLAENQRLERKLESETATGRQVVLILGAFPLVFLGMFYLLDTESTRYLFSMTVGQVTLSAVVLLVYAGLRWASRIMAIEA